MTLSELPPRQMHNLTAGLPLDRAIRGLEASLANPGFKRVLRDVVAKLERGNTLADALAQHPKVQRFVYQFSERW